MPNKILRVLETPVVFRDSSGDVVLGLQNLSFGAGRVSARYDRGAGAKPILHQIRGVFQFETPPIAGEAIELYLFESDGTYADGTIGTADAVLTGDKRRNGFFLGSVTVDTTSTATDIVATFNNVPIVSQYYSIGVWNASAGDNLENTANASRVIVTPISLEIQ